MRVRRMARPWQQVTKAERFGSTVTYTIWFRPGGYYHLVTNPGSSSVLLTGRHRRRASDKMHERLMPRAMLALEAYKAQ